MEAGQNRIPWGGEVQWGLIPYITHIPHYWLISQVLWGDQWFFWLWFFPKNWNQQFSNFKILKKKNPNPRFLTNIQITVEKLENFFKRMGIRQQNRWLTCTMHKRVARKQSEQTIRDPKKNQNMSFWLSKVVHLLEKSVINRIWFLLPISHWPNHYDWSRWFAISSLPPISSPSFTTFMGGVAKKEITKLGRENLFLLGHILSTVGDALIIIK